jgi:hypothetical protein
MDIAPYRHDLRPQLTAGGQPQSVDVVELASTVCHPPLEHTVADGRLFDGIAS